jgi:hypothetical protein
MSDPTEFTAPQDGATEARLELARGGTHISVRAAELDALCRARFEGVQPKATAARRGVVSIEYPRFSRAELLRSPAHRAEVELSDALPWTLELDGGLGDSTLDLRGLELRGLELGGGAGAVDLLLPPPRGVVRVRVRGGVSKVHVVHPEGSAVELRIAGGASKLAFDGRIFDALGGETRLETPDAARAADRYAIEILGGASRLTVREAETAVVA